MMSVLEYAQDVNKTVSEILNLCRKLNISVNSEEDEFKRVEVGEDWVRMRGKGEKSNNKETEGVLRWGNCGKVTP